MSEDTERQANLHSADAIVRHAGPYSALDVPVSMENPTNAFITKWIQPFYRWGIREPAKFIASYSPVRRDVNPELIASLLTWFNWRPRTVGAYFAAIERRAEFTDHIGKLLLRSDVCYAGKAYALALASFNNDRAIRYLADYLDYYLTKTDLYFDQGPVMGAIAHLDKVNGTQILPDYIGKWERYVADKPQFVALSQIVLGFEGQMSALRRICEACRLA